MSKVLIYSQEDLDLILELEKTKNEKLQQENQQLKDKIKGFENPINYFNYANKTLKDENQQLKKELECTIGIVEHNKAIQKHILKERGFQIQISAREEEYRKLEKTNKILSQELTKGNLIKQDHLTTCCGIPIGDIPKLKQENEELKKELEKYKEQVHSGLYSTCLPYKTGYDKAIEDYKTQQQEFIKYLEDETKEVEKTIEMLSDTNSCRIPNLKYKGNTLKEILQKYKETIGVKDENNL